MLVDARTQINADFLETLVSSARRRALLIARFPVSAERWSNGRSAMLAARFN
jgi:hypothetical protein